MLDKMRNGLNIFILFMFVVAIVYGIVIVIINAFNPKDINKVSISDQNVNIYMTQDNLITTDYSTFYSIEDCIKDIITALHDNKKSDIYNILTDEMKSKINNDTSKLTAYYNKNFKYDIDEGMITSGYQNYNNLKQVYKIDNNTYICVVTSINESKTTKIGLTIIDRTKYTISYIEM